jgi:hypothetical protein
MANTASAAVAATNSFMTGDDEVLRKQLIDIANTFWCDTPTMNKMVSFFSDESNIAGILEAKKEYGIPPKNRPSTRSGFLSKWKDYCDIQGCYTFYSYAKISMDFPRLDEKNKENCYMLKTAINSIKNLKASAEQNDKGALTAIDDKLAQYYAHYANMSCDIYIVEEIKKKDTIALKEEKKEAFEMQGKAYDKVADDKKEGTDVNKIATYGFVGVAALIFVGVAVSKMGKSND